MPERPLTGLLSAVSRRMRLRRLGLHLLWALLAALLTFALLGGLRALLTPRLGLATALGLSVLAGLLTLCALEVFGRRRPLTPLRAARLTERQYGLDELLSTALGLPGDGPQDTLSRALAVRVNRLADEAALVIRPASVSLPPAPRPLLAALALCALTPPLWLLSPAPVQEVGAAPVIRVESLPEAAGGAGKQEGASFDTPMGAPEGPEGQAGSVRTAAAVDAPGAMAGFLRESRLSQGDTSGVTGTAGGEAGGKSVDARFGSRESAGQAAQPTANSGKVLAAAPYDPGAGQGKTEVQKTGGQTGERQASGGRGLESDSRERCSASCLTNNDMNRSQAQRQRARPTGDESRAGTADSGGAAAGSSSAVGLGQGQARALPGQPQVKEVSGTLSAGGRIQVLGLNTAAARDIGTATGTAAGGPWRRTPEAALSTGRLSDEARAVVGRYFARGEATR